MGPGSDKFAITDFPVEELRSFTEQDFLEIAVLMKVLSPGCPFDRCALKAVLDDHASHLFVMRHSGAVQAEPGVVADDDAGPVHRPGRIIGCCTICLFASPTGLKASLEDVALLTFFQGHGLGRLLVESSLRIVRSMVSNKAREEGLPREPWESRELLGPQEKRGTQDTLELQKLRKLPEPHQKFSGSSFNKSTPDIQPKIHVQLTSKPQRKAANALYRSLGFTQKETNVYVLDI